MSAPSHKKSDLAGRPGDRGLGVSPTAHHSLGSRFATRQGGSDGVTKRVEVRDAVASRTRSDSPCRRCSSPSFIAIARRRRSLALFVIVFCIAVKLSAKKPFVVSPSFIAVVCRRRLHRRQPLPQDCKAGQSANTTGGLMRDNPKRSEAFILFLLFSPPFLPPFFPGCVV